MQHGCDHVRDARPRRLRQSLDQPDDGAAHDRLASRAQSGLQARAVRRRLGLGARVPHLSGGAARGGGGAAEQAHRGIERLGLAAGAEQRGGQAEQRRRGGGGGEGRDEQLGVEVRVREQRSEQRGLLERRGAQRAQRARRERVEQRGERRRLLGRRRAWLGLGLGLGSGFGFGFGFGLG